MGSQTCTMKKGANLLLNKSTNESGPKMWRL